MGKINTGILKDFTDGTYVHDVDFDQTFEIIRTAINDNYDKIVNRYTKAEVDGLLYTAGLGVASAVAVVDVLPTGTIQGKFYLKNPENVLWYYTGATWIQVTVAGDLTAVNNSLTSTITTHTNNTNNPHSVTTAQIGAIPLSQKGAVNGVPSLDANGKLVQRDVHSYGSTTLTGTFPTTTGSSPITYYVQTFNIPIGASTQEVELGMGSARMTVFRDTNYVIAYDFSPSYGTSSADVRLTNKGYGATYVSSSVPPSIMSSGATIFSTNGVAILDVYISGSNLVIKAAETGAYAGTNVTQAFTYLMKG